MTFAIALSLQLALAGAPHTPPPAPAAFPEASLGLSKTAVTANPVPPAVKLEDSSPGEKPLPTRAFPGTPPVIPHAMGDFLPISPGSNACLDCHAVKKKVKGEATPIPASHYEDLRNAPGKRGEKVSGARFVCTACHVQRSDAAPLVGNAFRPAKK